MDVSLKETSLCVVDGKGEIVSEGTVISDPAAIAAFIKEKARGAKRIGLETGPTTTADAEPRESIEVRVLAFFDS